MGQGIENEELREILWIKPGAVTGDWIAPLSVVIEHGFELAKPRLDGRPLGRVDLVSAWIIEVNVSILLARQIVAYDLSVRRRFRDPVRTWRMKELRLSCAIRRRPSRLGNRI